MKFTYSIYVAFLLFNLARCQMEKSTIAETLQSVPVPVGYWPLNAKFGANDASPNHYDAMFKSSKIVPTPGPFDRKDAAHSVGADNTSYIEVSRPEFDLQDKSFTISMLIRVLNPKEKQLTPLMEFPLPEDSSLAYGLNLWMWPNSTTLQTRLGGSAEVLLPCSFEDWAFIGAIYDNETRTVTTFCNGTVSAKTNSPMGVLTSERGFVVGASLPITGFRGSIVTSARVASVSIHTKALKREEMIGLLKLYKLFLDEPCQSSQCLPGTCRATGDTFGMYKCKCADGANSDADCIVPTTTPKPTTTPEPTTTPTLLTQAVTNPAQVKAEPMRELNKTKTCEPVCEEGTVCNEETKECDKVTSEEVSSGLKKEHIIAIIVVVAVILLIILIIVIYCCCCKKKKEETETGPEGVPLKQGKPTV